MINQLKELKIRSQGEGTDEVQCLIDTAILNAQAEEQERQVVDYTKSDREAMRAERLAICKEVMPILIATCNPHKRIPHRIAVDALEYADALIMELDK